MTTAMSTVPIYQIIKLFNSIQAVGWWVRRARRPIFLHQIGLIRTDRYQGNEANDEATFQHGLLDSNPGSSSWQPSASTELGHLLALNRHSIGYVLFISLSMS